MVVIKVARWANQHVRYTYVLLQKVCTYVTDMSTSTGTHGADYINAIWGECLGSTAQHILCVSPPSEMRFMDGCDEAR